MEASGQRNRFLDSSRGFIEKIHRPSFICKVYISYSCVDDLSTQYVYSAEEPQSESSLQDQVHAMPNQGCAAADVCKGIT